MVLLKNNFFNEEVPLKVSPTGVTFLHQNNFKNRYIGSKRYHLQNNAICEKKQVAQHKKSIDTSPVVAPEKKPREYKINKREIKKRILAYVISCPDVRKELYFFTVTFPEGISDDAAFIFYNTWLTKLRTLRLIKNYVWVSERQQNGTIHFHIAIPHKMPVFKANREMRVVLINASRKKLIADSVNFLMKYNGVHISKSKKGRVVNFAVSKKKKSLVRYLTKYVTKNNTKFKHLAWHNSRDFSSLFTGISFSIKEFSVAYDLKKFVHLKAVIVSEFYNFYRWRTDAPSFVVKQFQLINSFIFSN